MNKTFAAKLLERVIVTFLAALAACYTNILVGADGSDVQSVGQFGSTLHGLESLSLMHKAVAAALLATIQLVASVLIAPHVGDPNSPDLVPSRFLGPKGDHSAAVVGKYAASAELQHLLQQTAASNPESPLTTDAVLEQAGAVRVPSPVVAAPAV